MIATLAQDFKTLLGRLGGWPSDFGPEVALSLYNVATQNLPINGTAVDLTPSGGKSTVVLSAAAFHNGGKVVALVDKGAIHPAEEMWLTRAFRLFKLKDTCVLAEKIENMMADMIVVRGNEKLARSVYSEGLKPEGILFGINMPNLDSVAPEQTGNGWACWRKPKATSTNMPNMPNVDPLHREVPIVLGEHPAVIEEAIVISEEEAASLRVQKSPVNQHG